MGIASLVLGIISLVVSFVPFCGIFGIIPAIVGFGLGLAETIIKGKKNLPRGMAIAGLILNILAVVIIILWFVIFAAASASIPSVY